MFTLKQVCTRLLSEGQVWGPHNTDNNSCIGVVMIYISNLMTDQASLIGSRCTKRAGCAGSEIMCAVSFRQWTHCRACLETLGPSCLDGWAQTMQTAPHATHCKLWAKEWHAWGVHAVSGGALAAVHAPVRWRR